MKLQVYWSGVAATLDLRERLERRLAFALGRFGDEVSHVWAQLADANGPRGGVDKRVSLRVRGRRLKDVRVTDADSSLSTAIDRASDRLGRSIGRALERANGHAHGHRDMLPERARTLRRR
ncbi:MAG: HPF/RaiA family ribosome-associated protein [Planctomycetota bacterium]